MTSDNTIKYIINLKLMKLTGLYQLLNPDNPKSFGYNIFKLGGTLAVVYLILVIIMCNLSIYYSLNDFTEVIKYVMLIIATLFASTKMCFVILYSDELWKLIRFTSIDYLSYKGHKKYIHIKARKLSKSISNIFTLAWIAVISVWILSPIIIKDNFMNVKSKDETYNRYRYNMLNLIFPVSAQFYNKNFKVFYFFESIALIVYGYSMMVFDCLVISMCITITYQLKSIALSYSALGYKNVDTDFKSIRSKPLNEISNDLNNLILIIQDHQKCIKTINEVYNVLRPILLFQLFTESTLITLQPFFNYIGKNLNKGLSVTSPESIKLILSALTNIVHLFSTCYIFNIINTHKDSINFALYNCNWINKNIVFKKLLLLSMKINNSEKLKLKASSQIIVNLQLFTNVIHTTYKIISVLVNQYR